MRFKARVVGLTCGCAAANFLFTLEPGHSFGRNATFASVSTLDVA